MTTDSSEFELVNVVWVHRNKGDGFTHFDSEQCPCKPIPQELIYEKKYNRHRDAGGNEAQEDGGSSSAGETGEDPSSGGGSDGTGSDAGQEADH